MSKKDTKEYEVLKSFRVDDKRMIQKGDHNTSAEVVTCELTDDEAKGPLKQGAVRLVEKAKK